MNNILQWIMPGILFLVVVGFGVWVSKVGKPYNGILFNIHKLIALGAVILTGIRIVRLDPFSNFPTTAILLLALAGLGVGGLFATGAVMSIQNEIKPELQWIHGIAAVVIGISLVVVLTLF